MLAFAFGCRQNPQTPPTPAREDTPARAAPPSTSPAQTENPFLSNDCPLQESGAEQEAAALAAALVPLKPGLTLSTTWHRATQGDDIECLTHIQGVDGKAVAATANCSMSIGTEGGSRRTCRTDMRGAHAYYTGAGDNPDVLRGTTMFSLSSAAFSELKSSGSTRHRYVSVLNDAIAGDLDGELKKSGIGTVSTIVNDRVVELPVIRAAGTLRGQAMGKPLETRVTAAIVDDGRFPLVLEYGLPDIGAAGFSVRYSKISFPTDGKLEQQLASDQRIDVYGIYFDVNSHHLRAESDPVLQEIANALRGHQDWQLTIDGHTDSVGSAQANLDLSRRRSEAVRTALVDRFGVAAARLSTRGHGAAMPKDTNTRPEGRARNRRVELVRQP